jgi:hypothetical protein
MFRCTFIYRQGDVGWTDTFFNTAGSIAQLTANANNLITPLMDCRDNSTVLEAIRLSDDLVFRDSNFIPLTPVSGIPGNFSRRTNVIAAEPENSIDIRLETPADPLTILLSKHRRIFALRGLTNDFFNGSTYAGRTEQNAVLTSLQNALKTPANQWALKVLTYSALASNLRISGIAADGTVTAGPSASFTAITPGMYLTFHKLRGVAPPATRPFLITSVDSVTLPNTLVIRSWNRPPVLLASIGTATISAGSFSLQNIAEAIIDGVGRHKVGRPFDLRRGRRSPAR